MFYVLSLLCVQERSKKDIVGVRFLDVDSTSIFDMDTDTLRSAHRNFSLAGYEDYVDVLKPAGTQLLTEYEILNPNLGIVDKSTDPYTIATLVVGGFSFSMVHRVCYNKARGDVKKLLKYYNAAAANEVKKSEMVKEKKDKIVYEFEKTGVTFYQDFGFARTAVAICKDGKLSMIGEGHFDRTNFASIPSFEIAFNQKWSTSFNMSDILGRSDAEAQKLLMVEQQKESHIKESLSRGEQLSQSFVNSLSWKGQKNIGGFSEVDSKGYILNLPYKKLHVFNLENNLEREIYEDFKKGVLDGTWCHCGYKGTDTKYVENYKGVSHGYLCPKCRRFKQIG